MGICIKTLEEDCCNYLNRLDTIDGDEFTKNKPTIDNILTCSDKYILIEEKSFLLNFFRKACKGKRKFNSFIKDGELKDSLFDFLATLSKDEKHSIFKESSSELLSEIPEKVKVTQQYLDDENKVKNSKNVILYCNSGTEIDRMASIIFAKYNNEEENTVLECQKLEKFLKVKGCA